jgi:hypothetical protein
MYIPRPIKPPTGSELSVLFWMIFLILVGFGAVCLFFGYRAPVEKAQEASKLIRGGYGFIATGFVMLVVRRLFSGFS